MASRRSDDDHPGRPLAAIGIGIAMVVCCAAPALIAAGTLGALGAALRSIWLIVLGSVVLAGAVAWAAWRRRSSNRDIPGD